MDNYIRTSNFLEKIAENQATPSDERMIFLKIRENAHVKPGLEHCISADFFQIGRFLMDTK